MGRIFFERLANRQAEAKYAENLKFIYSYIC